jgi:shikimate dehydrogenase
MQDYRLGLIGWPVAHSLSPWIHRKALQACGLRGEYNLYAVDPLCFDEQVRLILQKLRNGELNGVNVTIPHKQRVLVHLDRLTGAAKAAGAANTLYLEEGALVGDNTDIPGFWMDLERLGWVKRESGLAHSHKPTSGSRAIILGAGGAARAVALALGLHGWQVGLAARREAQAAQAAAELSQAVAPATVAVLQLAEDMLERFGNPVDLIINATPVGMYPRIEEDPWPSRLQIPSDARVYDLVYNPLQTRFLRRAQASISHTANGLGMLVGQAVLAFHRWTGHMPSFDRILNELFHRIDVER